MHLGDLVSLEVIEQSEKLCRFEAVRGNCDNPDLRRVLSPMKILEISGARIGMIHSHGGPKEALAIVKQEFSGKVDIALFGHTHIPYCRRENGTLFLNPGSLRSGRGVANSYGILHIDAKPWGEIVEL